MADSRKSNVIKFKKNRFSIGKVLMLFIFLYIFFFSVHFLRKEHIGIYAVNEKQMSDNNTVVGIAVRTEDIYTAPASGYVSFYNSRGSKVGRDGTLFSIDPTGEINDLMQEIDDKSVVSEENIRSIRTEISSYKNNFSYSDYNQVYDFKYLIESLALTGMSEKAYEKLVSSDNAASLAVKKAATSGVVAYWTDSLEGINADNISSDSFSEEDYEKTMLKSSDNVSQGSNVCKVITSENWEIIIQVSEDQLKKIQEKNSVKFRFCKDDVELDVPYEVFSRDGINYARLFLSDYVSRYIDDRYIKLELLLNSAQGLKIPVSSIVEKSCFIIPAKYLTKGDNSENDMLVYEKFTEDGIPGTDKITTFAYCDEEYVYVDGTIIPPGIQIINPENDERFSVEDMCTLKGVYNVNDGFCQFKYVDIMYENEEYYIVKKNTKYGLTEYDHIIINPDMIDENDIIY